MCTACKTRFLGCALYLVFQICSPTFTWCASTLVANPNVVFHWDTLLKKCSNEYCPNTAVELFIRRFWGKFETFKTTLTILREICHRSLELVQNSYNKTLSFCKKINKEIHKTCKRLSGNFLAKQFANSHQQCQPSEIQPHGFQVQVKIC